MEHLVFYDGECGICDQFVHFLLKNDKKELFIFASLQGETAKNRLQSLPEKYKNLDSVILIENYLSASEINVQSKAVFKIFWLLGGIWAIPGLLSFLPSYLFDWSYRLFARHRHRFFPKTACVVPSIKQRKRFLD